MIIDENVEDFLEHYGVKGMKWGERRARNRQLNRESRKKDWAKQERDVERARTRVYTGKTKADYKKAKEKYKSDKLNIGSREAKKLLLKARNKKYSEISKAQEAKNKKEVAVILGVVGAATLLQVVGSATRVYRTANGY